MTRRAKTDEIIAAALDSFQIELPSGGFANTGTRFGKFLQPAAPATVEEKFSDAAEVHRLTGVCPTIALHVLWDLPDGMPGVASIRPFSEKFRLRPGSINPNLFQDQLYKHGSVGSPDATARAATIAHLLESADIASPKNAASEPPLGHQVTPRPA
jgi:L-rhamnose isomerase/sugar isomerase